MMMLAMYKLLLYGGLAFLLGSLVALEVFLNWMYPLAPGREKPHAVSTPNVAPPPSAAGRPA